MIQGGLKSVIRFPKTVIAVWLLLTLIMGWNIPRLKIEPDVREMLPEDFRIVRDMQEMEEIFGSSEIIVMAIASEDVFQSAVLEKIDRITREVEALPLVDRVVSLTNAEDVIGTDFGFEVREIIDGLRLSEPEVERIKERIRHNELLYGSVVSRDFRHGALLIMPIGSQASDADERIYQALCSIRERYKGPEAIYLAGLSITRREVADTMQGDMKRLFPYGIILMIFFLVFSFRSWIGAFLPFVIIGIVVINTLGLMVLLGMKFTFIGLMIPVMLIAVTSSYSIHIITHYFDACYRSSREYKSEAIIETVQLLQTPVFLSGLTTLIGFLSLQSHVLPPARQLGILVSFGIILAFLLCITFLPAALQFLPFPVFRRARQSTRLLNDRNLAGWGHFFLHHRWKFLISITVVVVLIATGIPRVKVDTNPVNFFHKESEFRQASEFTDREFGGSSQLSILAKGDIKDPEFLRRMQRLSDYLLGQPAVTQVTSIVDQLELMNRAFHGDSLIYQEIPATREMVAQYLLLYSLTGDPQDLDRCVDYDYGKAQILARVLEIGSGDAHRLYLDIKDHIRQQAEGAQFPIVTGMTAFVGILADMVVNGQIRSLVVSILLVFGVTTLIFRSFVAGLLSIIPLSGAIIILFGLMGYLGIPLDMATVMLSSIMIGVGVDYTVHFIYRYRRELRLGTDPAEAVPCTMQTGGKGILYNAFSVIIGFAVLMLSGFLPIYFFGFLIVISITACLLGALTLIPALLVILKPAFITKKRSHDENFPG